MPQGHIRDANTVALWRFDESGGALVDETGAYTLPAFGPPLAAAGVVDRSRYFNGSSHYFQGALSAGLAAVLAGAYTIEFWLYVSPDIASGFGAIFQLAGATSDTSRWLYIFHGGSASPLPRFSWTTVAGTSTSFSRLGSTLKLGGWRHYALRVRVAGSLRDVDLFEDGKLFASVAGVAPPAGGSTARFTMGRDGTASATFLRGALDDMRISNVARTDAEILESYERGIAPDGPPPQAPPTVEDVQPPPGDDLPPEAVVTFKVRDDVGLRRVLVFVRSASTYEVAFDGLNFGPRYADASSRAPLADGWTFELRRRNGWPKGSVSVEVLPVDTAGQFDA